MLRAFNILGYRICFPLKVHITFLSYLHHFTLHQPHKPHNKIGLLQGLSKLTLLASVHINQGKSWYSNNTCKICGPHGSHYEDNHLLGCDAMYSGRNLPAFQSNMLPLHQDRRISQKWKNSTLTAVCALTQCAPNSTFVPCISRLLLSSLSL